MVISGGANIYPAENEVVLIEMLGVNDCAIFGIPDEEFGESLCTHILPETGSDLTVDGVRTYLGQHMANYKIPKAVKFVTTLPREDSGKFFKRKLRALYWEGVSGQI